MRRTYKTDLKMMSADNLKRWIDRQTEIMIECGDNDRSTPLLTRIVYAKNLLAKMESGVNTK